MTPGYLGRPIRFMIGGELWFISAIKPNLVDPSDFRHCFPLSSLLVHIKPTNVVIVQMWVIWYIFLMGRISIDVSTEDHQKLKALAALQGKSIKDYVLERALGSPEQGEIQALSELVSFLDERIHRAEQKRGSSQSIEEVFQSVCDEKGLAPSNA